MEEFKSQKPLYSQSCEKLYVLIVSLLMPNGELNPKIDFMRSDASNLTSFQNQKSKLTDISPSARESIDGITLNKFSSVLNQNTNLSKSPV
jgi:hypothetical protein